MDDAPSTVATSDVTPEELDRLERIYANAREHDEAKMALRREGEQLIVDLKLRGADVKDLQHRAGLSHQRIYQILNRAGAGTQQRKPRTTPSPEEERAERIWSPDGERDT